MTTRESCSTVLPTSRTASFEKIDRAPPVPLTESEQALAFASGRRVREMSVARFHLRALLLRIAHMVDHVAMSL